MKIKGFIILIYILALWVEAAVPDVGDESFQIMPQGANNFLHIPAYGLLAWLIMTFLDSVKPAANLLHCALVSFLVGLVAELIQFFTPGRFASVFDIGLNTVGILLAVKGYKWYQQRSYSP